MLPKKRLARSDFWRSDRFIFIVFVAIALLWWLLISLNRTAEKTVDLPLEYQVPVGFLSDQSNPTHIPVTIRGEGWDLIRNVHRLLPGSLEVNLKAVENQFLTKADLAYMLNNQFNPGSPGIHFDIQDEGIRVFLVPASTRLIPLSMPKSLHVPASTQLAGRIQLEPDSILISGPISILDTIQRWPLHLEDAINQPGVGHVEQIVLQQQLQMPVNRRFRRVGQPVGNLLGGQRLSTDGAHNLKTNRMDD